MSNLTAELRGFLRNPRRWLHNANHSPCPVCGAEVHLGREWHRHKLTHDPAIWRARLTS